MQIKVFNIRLERDHFENDQNSLNSFLKKVNFKKSSVSLIEGKSAFWSIVIHFEELENRTEQDFSPKAEEIINEAINDGLSEKERLTLAHFKEWRLNLAKESNLPAFTVMTDRTLIEIVKKNPKKTSDLAGIYGLGESKISKFGNKILSILSLDHSDI